MKQHLDALLRNSTGGGSAICFWCLILSCSCRSGICRRRGTSGGLLISLLCCLILEQLLLQFLNLLLQEKDLLLVAVVLSTLCCSIHLRHAEVLRQYLLRNSVIAQCHDEQNLVEIRH